MDTTQTPRPGLTPAIAALYIERRPAILARLADFAAIPRDDWFYELCYCLLTPQSRAIHAGAVVHKLQDHRFFEEGGDVLHLLRNKDTYIRFHNVKHARLHAIRNSWADIDRAIASSTGAEEIRDVLVEKVNGLGMKEASHFLRNIGFRGLAILDRHLLTNLLLCGVYTDEPPIQAHSQYRKVETAFKKFASSLAIDLDELDLLFWSAQTGMILK